MPTIYTSSDAGLPAIPGTAQALAKFTYMKDVLKASLVNGYGSKAAAGWDLIDDGSTFIVLRNSSGRYATFVCGYVYNATANMYPGFKVFLSATYTGMSGNTPQGMGVVSGIASGSSQPQWFGFPYLYSHPARTGWMMIADDKSFVWCGGGPTSISPSYAGVGIDMQADAGAQALYVGDTSDGNFVSTGGGNIVSTSSYVFNTYTFSGGQMTLLYNPLTGLLVDSAGISANLSSLTTWVSQSAPSQNTAISPVFEIRAFDLARAVYTVDGAYAGYLRGVCFDPSMQIINAATVRASIDETTSPASMSQAELCAPITRKLGGYSYNPLVCLSRYRVTALITDNPEFWP